MKKLAILLTLITLILSACGGQTEQVAETSPEPIPEPIVEVTPLPAPNPLPKPEPQYQVQSVFEDLYAQNNDFLGWVRIPDTDIDYPVTAGVDNAFYLNHAFDKSYSSAGTPFLDMGADLINNNQSLSIYAHYQGNGSMFTDLHDYKDLAFYQEHPLIKFDTIYDPGVYKIFSVFYMAGNYSDKHFYYYPNASFADEQAFMNHVGQMQTRSIYDIPVDIAADDQLLLLTVCTYEADNMRLIVAGRKVRPDESYEVDTQIATINPDPLHPHKMYTENGLTVPDAQALLGDIPLEHGIPMASTSPESE